MTRYNNPILIVSVCNIAALCVLSIRLAFCPYVSTVSFATNKHFSFHDCMAGVVEISIWSGSRVTSITDKRPKRARVPVKRGERHIITGFMEVTATCKFSTWNPATVTTPKTATTAKQLKRSNKSSQLAIFAIAEPLHIFAYIISSFFFCCSCNFSLLSQFSLQCELETTSFFLCLCFQQTFDFGLIRGQFKSPRIFRDKSVYDKQRGACRLTTFSSSQTLLSEMSCIRGLGG